MDSLTILKENKKYSAEEFLEIFNLTINTDIMYILQDLQDLGYLRIILKSKNKVFNRYHIKKIFKSLSWDELNTEILFSVNFVGILKLTKKIYLLVYPKYLSELSIDRDVSKGFIKFNQIIKVIEKYKYRRTQNISDDRSNIDDLNNDFSLHLNILKSYYDKGLFIKEEERISSKNSGKILWNNTINTTDPFIINNTPLYLEFLVQENISNFSNLITSIHSIIISKISIDNEVLLRAIGFEPIILTDKSLEDIGTTSLLVDIIKNELENQYVTDNIDILTDLLLYIKQVSYITEDDVQIYGTSSYNMVWEDVCEVVYGNHLDYRFKDLEIINPQLSSDDTITLRDYIEKPKWLNSDNEFVPASSTLQLDVLNISNGKFNIYDAKYYDIELIEGEIEGQPGVSDITKQYLYQLAFKDVIEKNQLTPSNSFIIPKDGLEKAFEIYTIAKMDMFHELYVGLKPISVIAHDCTHIYGEYLKCI